MLDFNQFGRTRRMVQTHEGTWLVCYMLPPHADETNHLALAVRCTQEGVVKFPDSVKLIRFDDGAWVNPTPAVLSGAGGPFDT